MSSKPSNENGHAVQEPRRVARSRDQPTRTEASAALLLGIAWFTLFTVGTDLFIVSPLIPQIAQDLHASATATGWLVTTFALSYVLAAPKAGSLADRTSRQRVLLLGLSAFALANALTALAPTLTIMLLARVVAGIAAAAITPTIYALVGGSAPRARRGTRLAFVGSGLLTSIWLSVPAGDAIATNVGFRWIFAALGATSLALLFANRRVWRAQSSTNASADRPRAAPSDALNTWHRSSAVAVTALWGSSIYVLYTYLGAGLTDRGYDNSVIELVLLAYGVGAVVSSLAGGRIADRFGSGRTATASMIGLAVSQILLGVTLDVQGLLPVWLGLVALLGYAAFPAHQSRLMTLHPSRTTSLLAWNNSALYVGISCGSIIGGAILTLTDFAVIPFVAAGIALIGSVVSCMQDRYGSFEGRRQRAR